MNEYFFFIIYSILESTKRLPFLQDQRGPRLCVMFGKDPIAEEKERIRMMKKEQEKIRQEKEDLERTTRFQYTTSNEADDNPG
jgi:hypothetical protein